MPQVNPGTAKTASASTGAGLAPWFPTRTLESTLSSEGWRRLKTSHALLPNERCGVSPLCSRSPCPEKAFYTICIELDRRHTRRDSFYSPD